MSQSTRQNKLLRPGRAGATLAGMAEILSLRRARKAKARSDKEAAAATNRARFGEPPAVRDLREARERQQAERLEALKRAVPKLDER